MSQMSGAIQSLVTDRSSYKIGQDAKQSIVTSLTAEPTAVENIRKMTGLKNWESTKALCLELLIEKKISGTKTSRGWLFWSANSQDNKSLISVSNPLS